MKTARLAIILVILSLGTIPHFAQGHGGGCHCGTWASTPIEWEIKHTDSKFFNAAASEFDNWNNVATLFTYSQKDSTVDGQNGENEIGFLTIQQVNEKFGLNIVDQFTFGFAPSWPETAFGNFNECPRPPAELCNGTYTEADVVMNADFFNGWTSPRPPDFDDENGPALYEATALHEIGHTIGLHHNFNNLSTMNYYHDFAAHYLAIADAAAVRAAYPGKAKSMTDMATYPFRYDPNLTSYDAVTAVTVSPALVNAGASLTVNHVTVENVGTADLTNVRIQFYLSQDATITASDILLGQGAFEGTFFTGGYWDTGSGAVSVKVPANTPSGTYYFGARIVYNTSQTDTITYNNTWVGPTRITVSGSTGGGPCAPSATDLCLSSSRFRVTLAAVNPRDGRTGGGFTIPYNNQNGFFAIPELTNDTTNFEVFVKILDGRPINGKFWVFYGGLTDFEYTITVTDTQTGVQKQYTKPGLQFTGGADTNAF